VASRILIAGHWPPSFMWQRRFPLLESLGFPAGSSFKGPLDGGCSHRVPRVYLACWAFLQQPIHHWHLLLSNKHAIQNVADYARLTGNPPGEFMANRSIWARILLKTVEGPGLRLRIPPPRVVQTDAEPVTAARSPAWALTPLTPLAPLTPLLPLTAGRPGNSGFHAPPVQCVGSASGSGGKVRPCAGTRNAPVGKSPALRRRPHNPKPRILPAG